MYAIRSYYEHIKSDSTRPDKQAVDPLIANILLQQVTLGRITGKAQDGQHVGKISFQCQGP